MFANGPPCTKAGVFSRVCTRLGASASRSTAVIAPCAPRSRAVHRLPVARVADDDVAETLLEVMQVGCEAEDRHDLGGDHDVEARLARVAVAGSAQPDHDVAQCAVAHVQHAAPRDPSHVDAERVAVVDVVVDHRGEQVGRDGDRREVAGEVQVDVLHRHDLGIATARGAALHAEHRPERRFAQADHGSLADARERVAEPHGRGRLAFAGGRGRDGCDEHQPARRPVSDRGEVIERDLRLVATVGLEALFGDAEALGHHRDRQHVRRLRDVDVAEAHRRTLLCAHPSSAAASRCQPTMRTPR